MFIGTTLGEASYWIILWGQIGASAVVTTSQSLGPRGRFHVSMQSTLEQGTFVKNTQPLMSNISHSGHDSRLYYRGERTMNYGLNLVRGYFCPRQVPAVACLSHQGHLA